MRLLVDRYRASSRDRLPPVAELATRCGVSLSTAWKATRVLCDEGLLVARRGSGIRIVSPPPAPLAPLFGDGAATGDTLARWQRLSSRIVEDHIIDTAPESRALPAAKALAFQYGASLTTIRRALRSLADEGRIHRRGRAYRITTGAPDPASGSVVLIAPSKRDGTLANRFPNDEENVRWLGRRCGAERLTLHTLAVAPGTDHLFYAGPERVSVSLEDLDPLGYLVWLPGSMGSTMGPILRRLPPRARPVALCASQSHLSHAAGVRMSNQVRGFSTPDYGWPAGLDIGRTLARLGHSRVLCVFPANRDQSAVDRLEGVRRGICAGRPGATVHVAAYTDEDQPPLAAGRYQHVYDAFVGRAARACGDNDELRQIADAVEMSPMLIRERVRTAQVTASVHEAYRRVPRTLKPTAVVAFNDEIGVACLRILRARGLRVPGNVSLISFDDTLAATLSDITSYNFNESKVMSSMLDWVLWPDRRKRRGIVAPPRGFVTQRRSTARVGRAGSAP